MAKVNFDKQNDRVIGWANKTEAAVKGKGNALGIVHRSNSPSPGASMPKVKNRVRYKNDVIERIIFRFPRTLIWTHKGAGKGRGGEKGSKWVDKLGITHTTNPASFGKMGTGGRKAKPFFNDVMDSPSGVNELADIVAEESGDVIVNNLLIK